tara:strand:+ start:6355 stop:6945 length:591 start_codon:yes stop_codon:yes gene_type:complete
MGCSRCSLVGCGNELPRGYKNNGSCGSISCNKLSVFDMKYYLVAIIIFSLLSCDSKMLYEKNLSIENTVWDLSNKPHFKYNNADTALNVNLKVNVRHSSSYPFSNLWLFINTIDPAGVLKKDTLECILAQKDGKWLGSGLGDVWDIQCQFKSNLILKQGIYTFEIEQAMRHSDLAKIEQLPGIMEIGIRIEKQEYK